jgi:hypothetical protein
LPITVRVEADMPKKRWKDLSPRARRLILLGATLEGFLKLLALVDLKRRPASEVNGSKARWATAIVLVNSGGLVPVAYLLRGRRPAHDAARGTESSGQD